MSAEALGVRRSGRLAFALIAIACGSTSNAPPYGQLQFPAGAALVHGLLLVSSQDDDALHVYDTRQQLYVPAPSPLLPLSIPTVRRPGLICSDGTQAYVLSSTDPYLAVVDAENNPSTNNPLTGLRELGQVQLRSMGNALSCGPGPQAVLQYKIDAGGSPAGYEAALLDGSLDQEREAEALMGLPSAALVAVLTDAGRTMLQEVTNDSVGTSPACRRTLPIEECGDGGDSKFCMGSRYFCPAIQDLMTLPPQDPYCNPMGPPRVFSMDLNGSSIGAENQGRSMVGPLYANLLALADTNSSCIALVDLDTQQTTWVLAGGPTVSVSLVTPLPNTCIPGGSLLAAVLAPGGCDASFCGGVVFIDVAKALADPLRGRLPAPLPYPFTQSPDLPEAPVRVLGFLTSSTWTGSNLVILGSSVSNSALIDLAAAVGNANADLTLVEIGMGLDGGGTGPVLDAGGNGYVTGSFPCPPNYLAPRLIDINDYLVTPLAPAISTVAALDVAGNPLQATIPHVPDQPLTNDGAPLPAVDRLGQPFPVPAATTFVATTPVNCFGFAIGSKICFTDGLVQHGVANDEIFTVRYQGTLDLMNNLYGTWDSAAATVTFLAPFDPATHLGGVLTEETQNLGVNLAAQGLSCDYGINSVSSTPLDGGGFLGTMTVLLADGGPFVSCPPSQPVAVTVFATGAKPYTVEGTASGFIGLWPNDGSLQFVVSGRWQYPRNLIQMLQQAEQLSDLVLGVPNPPLGPAPGSTVTYPRPDGGDEVALNSAFGLALFGALGPPLPATDGGSNVVDAGGVLENTGVSPQRGASWTFLVNSGVTRLVQTSIDAALIETMTAQIDSDGGQHIYAACRGGDAVIDAQPTQTLDPYTHGIFEIH